jgi:putative ABC transport system permease protein
MTRWSYAFNIAAAELKSGIKGFRLFLVCLAIGVAAIAAAGSMAQAFRSGLDAEQRRILGGDFVLTLRQRTPTPEQVAFFKQAGRISQATDANTMGSFVGASGEVRRLIQVRAVDSAHPLEGSVTLAPAGALQPLLVQRDGVWGGVAEQALLDAFKLKVGDTLNLPYGKVQIRAVLIKEPDALGRGFAFSPRLMISSAALGPLSIGQTGSLFSTSLRSQLSDPAASEATKAAFEKAFPTDARALRDKSRSADGFGRALDRVELFLSCVGFSALLAGGLGVAGAVRGHLQTRRGSIAILKAMGASGGDVRLAYGLQILVLACLGALLGIIIGGAAPFLVSWVYGSALPIPINLALFPKPLASAAGIGLLCAFAFAAPPLGAARATPPSHLLRGGGADEATPLLERVASLIGLGALGGLFALTSPNPVMAIGLAVGAGLAWMAFYGLGKLAQLWARGAPKPGGAWGLGLAALGGPGSLAPAAAPALGLGLALLVALGQIQSNLIAQVRDTAPARAPSVAYTEIPDAKVAQFDSLIRANVPNLKPDDYRRTPVMTVRVFSLNGVEIDTAKAKPSERWFVEDEIGATWLATKPPSAKLVSGAWWPTTWNDPFEAQVSVEAEAAEGIGAKVGDTLGVLVSGREIEAKIANLRTVDWAGFDANFALVFAPGAFEGAQFRHFAIARLTPPDEAKITTALGKDFPAVGIVRVRDALAAAGDLFESLAIAIQAIAAVALAAGVAAVAGALTAGARRRLYEAAILKSLGASRARIVGAMAIEQASAGLIAALIGSGIGLIAAYVIVTQVLEADWVLNIPLLGAIIGGAVGLFAIAGAWAGFAALGKSPASVLAASAEFG